MDSNKILGVTLDIIKLVGGDSKSAPVAGGLKPSTKAKREQEKDKDKRRARMRRAKQSKLQELMNNSMQDLTRSSRTEARIAAFEKVWTAKLQLANQIPDSVAQAAGIERATTEYLAAIEKEIALPEQESQRTTSSSNESKDNVD
jgi:ATPase subunit of ABC transporter with duplicated ATPase domains